MSTIEDSRELTTSNKTAMILSNLEELAKRNQTTEQYFANFVSLLTKSVGAASGYVWKPGPEGMIPLASSISQIEKTPEAMESCRELAARVFKRPSPEICYPRFQVPQANSQRVCLLLPLFDNQTCFAVASFVTFVQSPEQAELQLMVLQTAVERMQKQLISIRYDSTTTELEQLHKAHRVILGASASLDAKPLAFEVVNRLREYFDVDRVSLTFKKGHECQTQGISNQAVFDRRANVVRSQEKLAAQAAKLEEPMWLSPNCEEYAPSLRKHIERHFDTSNAISIAVLPLFAEPKRRDDPDDIAATIQSNEQRLECVGVLMLEQMDSPLDRKMIEAKWKRVAPAISNAVANSCEHNSLFLMPLWRSLGHFADFYRGHTKRKAMLITGAVLATILALMIVPADFKLRGDGQIQPIDRRHVYAETEGTIKSLLFADGKSVAEGDPLLVLSNPTLAADLAEAEGELREAESKLETLTLQRVMRSFESEEEESELVRDSSTTDARVKGLRKKVALLQQSINQLNINSPMAGEVITWDSDQRLANRPVKRGDRLLTVALPSGEWEIELRIPDKRSGYLLDKWQELQGEGKTDEMSVSFVLASNPSKKFTGAVSEISPGSNADEKENDNVVRVLVRLSKEEFDKMGTVKPGTTVTGQVHCGRASIGYCKLYEFFDWTQRVWFKYVS